VRFCEKKNQQKIVKEKESNIKLPAGCIPPEAPFLEFRWPSSTVSPYSCLYAHICVLMSSSYEDAGQTGLEPTLMLSVNFNFL
jgi:hypothetical protein